MKTTSKTLAAIFGIAATAALAVPASAMDANSFERGPKVQTSAPQAVTISSSGSATVGTGSNLDLIEAGVGLNDVSRNAQGG